MLLVQKFGGSSVATLERIHACAQRCATTAQAGHRVVVVVSAMKGETDRLIGLANALHGAEEDARHGHYVEPAQRGKAYDRELDQLIATGEIVSSALLAMAIAALGVEAVSLTGAQIGMRTDHHHTRARIIKLDQQRIRSELDRGRVVVCAGFQGVGPHGDVTTLGRGGSDTSAVALAAALEADACEILTDVDGVYTSDPRLVPRARKVERITYDEMLELASLGAKVLQIRSVAFAKKYGVRVHVRSSLNDREGTWIVAADQSMEGAAVAGVALDRAEAKITLVGVPDVPGVIGPVFEVLGDAGIVIDMIIQNAGHDGRTDITFTLPGGDIERALELIAPLRVGGEPLRAKSDASIAKISLVGIGLRSHAKVAGRAFAALANAEINVQMVTNSELKMSIVVAETDGPAALRVLHTAFELDAPQEMSSTGTQTTAD